MGILAIATSKTPPKVISNRLTHETIDGYLIIKIKTVKNPNDYKVYGDSFYLFFEGTDHAQRFSNYILDGTDKSETYLIDKDDKLIEMILEGEPVFETTVEGKFFIIKIKEEIIKYKDYKINGILLTSPLGGRDEIYE
jgi:hypothetical protein